MLLEKLATLLLQEREDLSRNAVDAVPQLVSEKISLAEQLSISETRLLQCFENQGRSGSNIDLVTMVKEVGDPNVGALIAQVTTLLRLCKDRNNVNGRIVAASQQATNDLLSILKGQDKQGKTVYSPDGRLNGEYLSKSLVKA